MSASMAEVIDLALGSFSVREDRVTLAVHVAEQLAANGYGKLEDAWENGRTAGYDAGSRWARTGEEKDTPSPYRRPE